MRALWLLPLVLAACALRAPPRFAAADLPRAFSGRFVWAERDARCGYEVTVVFDAVVAGEDGRLAVRGSSRYRPGDYEMTVTGSVDPATLEVTLRESAPSRADAVVDGAFVGSLAPDLRSLAAVWTTDATGAKGTLTLAAEEPGAAPTDLSAPPSTAPSTASPAARSPSAGPR